MEKGSISSLFRVLVDVREGFDRRGHIAFFSGGDGLFQLAYHTTMLSLNVTDW